MPFQAKPTDGKPQVNIASAGADFYRALLESALDCIVCIDHEGKITEFNPAAERTFGHTRGETLGKDLAEIIVPPSLRESHRGGFAHYVKTSTRILGQRIETTGMRADGSEMPVELTVVRVGLGEPPVFMVSLRGLVERKQAEGTIQAAQDALRSSEERFRSLVQNSTDIVTVLEADGTIRYESPSLERLLGHDPEELKGKNAFEFVHPEDVGYVMGVFVERIPVPGTIPPIEFRFRHKDGSWRVLEAIGNNLLHDPRVAGVVINSRDISERKQLEEQLRQSQKMEAVGQLAGGLAHDFNNLLTIIGGHIQIQLEQLDAKDPLRHCSLEIQKAADQAASLIRRLMAFSRKEVAQPTVLDINLVVADVSRMLLPLIGAEIQLKTTLSEEKCLAKADATQLQQILVNLAVNARDAMPSGGDLIIATSRVELDENYFQQKKSVRHGSYVLLTVTDTGCGMDAATQAHIFEPFFSTKEKGRGTGLGLSIVYSIVTQSGGHIAVESRVQQGTTFRVYLPLATEDSKAVPLPQVQPEPLRHQSGTLLLVEDEQGVRQMLRDYLLSGGYAVLAARDGLEALEVYEQHRNEIDLVVTDMAMPRMGGQELTARLEEKGSKTPVLYMSGYTEDSTVRTGALEQGIFFIDKPFTLQALVVKIREALDHKTDPSCVHPRPTPLSFAAKAK